jgi:hypothetical protein
MSLRKICESIRASSRDSNVYENYGTYLLEAISRYAARKVAEDPKVKRTLARGLVPGKEVTQAARDAAAKTIRAERKADPDKVRAEYKAAKTKAGGPGSLFDVALDKPGRRPQTGGTKITYKTKDGKVQRVRRDPTTGRPTFTDEK